MSLDYRWRFPVTDEQLVELTRSHGGRPEVGWWDRIQQHSLGWVTAHSDDGQLVGFVNLAWDGCDHAFILDTKTRPDHQRRGVGTMLVAIASRHAKQAGCEWLHVDFEPELEAFYLRACGFRSTLAGLLHLPELAD
jgi:GNAT superfamily N-acetyltransferase